MDWIDETVAIGSALDARCVRRLKREKVDLIIDSRTLFSRPGLFSNVPDMNQVMKTAETMVELSGLKVRVLIFCRHGKDRSPFVAAIYYSKKYGVPCNEAYQVIMSKRQRTVYHPEWVAKLGASKSE